MNAYCTAHSNGTDETIRHYVVLVASRKPGTALLKLDTGGSRYRYTLAGRNLENHSGGLSMYTEGLADWRREGSTGARVLPGALAAT